VRQLYAIFAISICFSFIIYGCSSMPLQTKQMLLSPQVDFVNCALSSNGATAESPDNNPDHPPSEVIDGDISSLDWDNGGGWEGNLSYLRSNEPLKRSYIQIDLPEKKRVKRIVVYTIDSPKYPASEYGLRSYSLEYWHGTGWKMVDVDTDKRDKRFTVKDNVSGKIEHEISGELVTDKIRLVPLLSNDTEKEYDLTAFGGQPIYNISGSAKVIEMQVWCYPTLPKYFASKEQNNLSLIGKSQPSPDEQDIRKVLINYEQGYDNEDLGLVMSGFSDRFSTLDGKSRIDVEKKAEKFFAEYNNINITFRDTQIDIAPSADSAAVQANYTLDCVAEADNNVYRRTGTLVFNFKKEDSGWKIVNAK
jgi:ketosteroid isomerase-like protein